MRHLYGRKGEPGVEQAIELAKTHFERRRCGHHPDQYPEPLSAYDCIHSVVDPKQSGVNKHRYVCALNDDRVRASLRRIPGVPLIFIRRSVVLMEPMADATAKARSAEERAKFRAEIKTPPAAKRKRVEDGEAENKDGKEEGAKPAEKKKKTMKRGPKGPNPLSVKKPAKKPTEAGNKPKTANTEKPAAAEADSATEEQPKKKRKRKHKSGAADGEGAASTGLGQVPLSRHDEL